MQAARLILRLQIWMATLLSCKKEYKGEGREDDSSSDDCSECIAETY